MIRDDGASNDRVKEMREKENALKAQIEETVLSGQCAREAVPLSVLSSHAALPS